MDDTPKGKPIEDPKHNQSTWVYNTPEEQRLRHPEELDYATVDTQQYEPAVFQRTDHTKTVYKLTCPTNLARKVSVNLADLKPLCSLTGDEPVAKRIAFDDEPTETRPAPTTGLNWYEAEMVRIGTCKPSKREREAAKRELSRRCLTFYEFSAADGDDEI